MIYKDLLAFCQGLTEEQLQQEVYVDVTEDTPIKIEQAIVTTEDQYWEHHGDALGTLQEIKNEYPDDWEDIIVDAVIQKAGTVLLLNE